MFKLRCKRHYRSLATYRRCRTWREHVTKTAPARRRHTVAAAAAARRSVTIGGGGGRQQNVGGGGAAAAHSSRQESSLPSWLRTGFCFMFSCLVTAVLWRACCCRHYCIWSTFWPSVLVMRYEMNRMYMKWMMEHNRCHVITKNHGDTHRKWHWIFWPVETGGLHCPSGTSNLLRPTKILVDKEACPREATRRRLRRRWPCWLRPRQAALSLTDSYRPSTSPCF